MNKGERGEKLVLGFPVFCDGTPCNLVVLIAEVYWKR
jgi:hypothetical protein